MMKRALAVLVTLVGLSVVGCGGPTSDTDATGALPPSEEGGRVSQLATCSASCGASLSVSCTGSSCSSQDGQGVTCNGVFTSCASQAVCTGLPACSTYANKQCQPPGDEMDCCLSNAVALLVCTGSGGSHGVWRF
ncbi:MAG: hypothetical protein EOO71_02525 [Myxococcaceae bacterium]|nr:MAG: hypothetical protein EOO71_02525 [Myxococcaceae bacterium]